MAKKETNKTKKEDERHWKPVVGLVLCGFSVFLTIAFLSYCFTWKTSSSPDSTIYGIVGKFGYNSAESFVGAFGVGATILPSVVFMIGFRLLRRVRHFERLIFTLLSCTILLSVVPAYVFYPFSFAGAWLKNGPGGTAGNEIVGKMIDAAGGVGAGLLIVLVVVLFFLFLTPKTADFLKTAYFAVGDGLKLIFETIVDFFKHRVSDNDSRKDVIYRPERDDMKINDDSEKSIPAGKTVESKIDDNILIVKSNEEETKALDRKSLIPTFDPAPEFKTEEIEEIYLPEYMLTGELYDPTRDLTGYCRPPVDLLEDYATSGEAINNSELNRNKDKIVQILGNYKIGIDKIFATVGPTVTLYEIVPKEGIRIAQIKRLEDDVALRIAALGVRIIAPIPGKGTVGIEVPNERPDIVSMRSIIKSAKFQESKFDLPVALGKTILGEVYAFDLAKMPHLLIAGATGQGKSVGLNAILTSLLYKKHPAELKIVMVDPKKVELTPYAKIEKHFLAKLPDTIEPIITDTQKVIYTLKSLCTEMDSRYDLLKTAGVRNIKEYNEKFVNRRLNPEKGHKYMPYIVLVIDEFADMIMTAGREIEEPIARLAQLARAVGIHLIIATQRPTTNIITGLIKANFPARIAFRVASMIDSRTILDQSGANQLIGRGDMLVSTGSDLIRVQCAFVDTSEVDRVTDYIRTQPGYAAAYDLPEYAGDEKDGSKQIDMRNLDPMFEEAAKLIVQSQQGSTSLIQRKMSLGYNRAGRIMDQLEAAGIVGPVDGSKPRQVLIADFMSLDNILKLYK